MLTDEEIGAISCMNLGVYDYARAIERAVLAKAMTKQDPIGKICKSAECGGVDFYFDKIPYGETMLYAGPQPEQSVAIPTEQQILSVAKMVMPAAYLAEENYKICSFAYALLSASPKPE